MDANCEFVLSGNELIIQGGLEGGFDLYTGYPGSPLADYFNILYKKKDDLKKRGSKAVLANSEANAAAMASGAKQAGKDVLLAMKSMGLHVAADALCVGNFADPSYFENGKIKKGGVVVVVGDDPWSLSTSAPADSRFLFKHLHMPFLEPSTPQELKDWIKIAKEISKETSLYQGLLLTTFMAEGGGKVHTKSLEDTVGNDVNLDTSTFELHKNVMVPPNSLMADKSMIEERFPKVFQSYDKWKLDKILGNKDSQVGIISAGVIFETLKHVLEEFGLLGHISLYKLASSYPLNKSALFPYLKNLDHLIVVEEKRGFLESELAHLIYKEGLSLELWGKNFKDDVGFCAHGGLNFEIISEKLRDVLNRIGIPNKINLKKVSNQFPFEIPKRLPTFCPGCPHRETLSLLKDLRKTLKKKDIDLISHGDVGCYSLSFLPPFKEMHNLSAMGQGGALGSGLDSFSKNPSIVLMGDSTFFHSGMTSISHSIQMGHSITYILLDNGNTAMTGHQMTPRTGVAVDGEMRPRQSIEKTVKALGIENVYMVNPSDRYFYQNLLQDVVLLSGVKVIISNKECGLTFHGRRKAYERKLFSENQTKDVQKFFQINTDACEDCRECVESTGCPGLSLKEDAYGTKVAIDPLICVGDGYCTQIKACPSFEIVEVYDFHPTLYRKKKLLTESKTLNEPDYKISLDQIRKGRNFHIVVTGVGGSGVTTISKILSKVALGLQEDSQIDFKFVDQKGLAQRNGNVTGHLVFFEKGKSVSPITPLYRADLLLSPDIMDASRQSHFLSEDGKAFVDKTFQVPLTLMLDREEDQAIKKSEDYQNALRDLWGENVFLENFKERSYKKFGKSVYASSYILGAVYQAGYLPFSLEILENAFRSSLPKDEFENNWIAFEEGRDLYENPRVLNQKMENWDELYALSIKDSLPFWQSSHLILKFFKNDLSRLIRNLPQISPDFLARYLHDLYIYNRGRESERFINEASLLAKFYHNEDLLLALRALAKSYFIKDEIFISHIMVSPLRKREDHQNYEKLGRRYVKSFINRPHFQIGPFEIEKDFSPAPWMLKIMRHLRFLRPIFFRQHLKDKEISRKIRKYIVEEIHKVSDESMRRKKLKLLENIKGYRQIRFDKAERAFHEFK